MAKWTLGVVLSGIAIAGAALSAHHSLAGVYALGKEAKVHGTFNSFKIVNPHSSMKLDVKNSDGTVTEWSFVGGSAGQIARLGLKDGVNALHYGDASLGALIEGRFFVFLEAVPRSAVRAFAQPLGMNRSAGIAEELSLELRHERRIVDGLPIRNNELLPSPRPSPCKGEGVRRMLMTSPGTW